MKEQICVDAHSGLQHTMTTKLVNIHDITKAQASLHDEEGWSLPTWVTGVFIGMKKSILAKVVHLFRVISPSSAIASCAIEGWPRHQPTAGDVCADEPVDVAQKNFAGGFRHKFHCSMNEGPEMCLIAPKGC